MCSSRVREMNKVVGGIVVTSQRTEHVTNITRYSCGIVYGKNTFLHLEEKKNPNLNRLMKKIVFPL